MSDIAAFIRARLDEDQSIVEEATSGPWAAEDNGSIVGPAGRLPKLAGHVICSVGAWDATRPTAGDAAHIARHDPSRVLREVAAKRMVVDRYEAMQAGVEAAEGTVLAGASRVRLGAYLNVLHDLAAIWVDHPDFDPSWRTDG